MTTTAAANGEHGEVTVEKGGSCVFPSAVRGVNAVTADAQWTVKGCRALLANDADANDDEKKKKLVSPDFDIGCGDFTSKWFLKIELAGELTGPSDVGVWLVAHWPDVQASVECAAHHRVSLADGAIERDNYDQTPPSSYGNGYGLYRQVGRLLLSLDTLQMWSCVKNDQLVVKLTISVYHSHPEDLGRQFATLMTLYEQHAGDFIIRCCCGGEGEGEVEEDVRVFKALLVGASPVFTAMVATDMKEAKEGVLKIVDMSADTARSLVKFLYVGQITEEMDVSELLTVANKYQIEHLKKNCVRQLLLALSADNAFDMLDLAELHNATELKKAAMELIIASGPQGQKKKTQ